jgi:Na+/proline symporter
VLYVILRFSTFHRADIYQTVQVFLFSMNAAKLKLNAPFCHTFLEVIKVRFGTLAHCLAGAFAIGTNILVSSMLILGGSATVSSLTGINVLAACFLIPIVVSLYVLVGGMRATLLADYSHTVVLLCIILAFNFVVYATSDQIGSPAKMVELLEAEAITHPIAGNKNGSYLTFDSLHGGIFGILNIIGNFATVYLDQAYWQRAVGRRTSPFVIGLKSPRLLPKAEPP